MDLNTNSVTTEQVLGAGKSGIPPLKWAGCNIFLDDTDVKISAIS